MKQAIFFDFDGVIVDSENIHMFRKLRFCIENRLDTKLLFTQTMIGSNIKRTCEILSPSISNAKRLEKKYREYIKKNTIGYKNLIDKEIYELLEFLKSKKIICAIVSSSPRTNIQRALQEACLIEYFEFIISGDEFEHSKPAPDVYLAAIKKVSLPATDCIVIEDSQIGLKAAKRANLFTVHLNKTNQSVDKSIVNKELTSLKAIEGLFQIVL